MRDTSERSKQKGTTTRRKASFGPMQNEPVSEKSEKQSKSSTQSYPGVDTTGHFPYKLSVAPLNDKVLPGHKINTGYEVAPKDVFKAEETVVNTVLLRRAIKKLPPKQALAVHLFFDCDLNYSEAGRLLGISPQAAKNRWVSAIESLRRSVG